VSKTVWANFRPPEWVDTEAFLFCGADPSWTPEKEFRQATAPDNLPGKCSLCGGEGRIEIDGVEYLMAVAIEDGDATVCGRCKRYGRQHLIDKKPLPAGTAPKVETTTVGPETVWDDPEKPVPPPSASLSRLVVVCTEHADCVRRGDVHVPTKYAAMLERD
jgi:hypothetical protein